MSLENHDRFVHVITHGGHCLDGVTSAVVLTRYYSGERITPYFCTHREINQTLVNLRCDPSDAEHEVWITDIAWTDPAVDSHLQALIDRGVKIYLIDHHRTTLERFDAGHITVRLTDMVLSEAYAASRLVYDYLRQRRDSVPAPGFDAVDTLVALADDTDRWLHRLPASRPLAATVSAMESIDAYHELIGVDAAVTYTPRMLAARERARTELAFSVEVAQRSRYESPLPGTDLTLVTAVCAGYSSEIADTWRMAAAKTVFAFFDSKSLTVSLRRSADCQLDLSHVAARFGGGGHAAAAGFELASLPRQLAQILAQALAGALSP